jgi:hypothetical protein
MKIALQFILFFLTLIGTYLFVYFLPLAWIYSSPDSSRVLRVILSVFVALIAGLFVVQKIESFSDELATSIVMGGIIVGSGSFLIGFIGPMLFIPSANLGPLLGIFITGPIGFLVGLVAGGIYWKVKKKE